MASVVEARGLEASLRLKAYLKCAYALTDERCLSFNPDGQSVAASSSSLSSGNNNNSSSSSSSSSASERDGDYASNSAVNSTKRLTSVVDGSFLYSASPSEDCDGLALVDYKRMFSQSKLTFLESIAEKAESRSSNNSSRSELKITVWHVYLLCLLS